MSYSKKILELFVSCPSLVDYLDGKIRRSCIKSSACSVDQVFKKVCALTEEKSSLLKFYSSVNAVLSRLPVEVKQILFLKGYYSDNVREKFNLSRSSFFRKLHLAEQTFIEYLSFVGLDELSFKRDYSLYPWAQKVISQKPRQKEPSANVARSFPQKSLKFEHQNHKLDNSFFTKPFSVASL